MDPVLNRVDQNATTAPRFQVLSPARRNQMKKVLIDYGEVISESFPLKNLVEMAELSGLEPGLFERRYWQCREPYDAGGTDLAYWKQVLGVEGRIDNDLLTRLVELDVDGWLMVRPEADEWLSRISATGNPPWLLSNAPHSLADAVEALPIASLFGGMIFSARVGLSKPDPACFDYARKAMGLSAGEILFIDDREVNINAARHFGMNVFQFTGSFPELTPN